MFISICMFWYIYMICPYFVNHWPVFLVLVFSVHFFTNVEESNGTVERLPNAIFYDEACVTICIGDFWIPGKGFLVFPRHRGAIVSRSELHLQPNPVGSVLKHLIHVVLQVSHKHVFTLICDGRQMALFGLAVVPG